jgi:hypothetical protein
MKCCFLAVLPPFPQIPSYNNYKNLIDTKENRDINYTPSQYTENYPSLKVGDLIKTKVGLKQGKFGVYLDEFSKPVNGIETKFYVVLLTSNDGNTYDWKTIPETDLKFKNPTTKQLEFVIKKQLDIRDTLDIDLNTISNKSNVIQNPLTITTKSKQETDDLLKIANQLNSQTRKECYDEMREIVESNRKEISERLLKGEDNIIKGELLGWNEALDKIIKQLDNKEGK